MSRSRKSGMDMQSLRMSQTMAAIEAERDFFSKADAQALTGKSPIFSQQLWKATKLTPKLMGSRRDTYIREQGEAQQAAENELAVAASSARGARAVDRACRQRFVAAQEEVQERRGLKALKEAAIAEFQRSVEKVEKDTRREKSSAEFDKVKSGELESSVAEKSIAQDMQEDQQGRGESRGESPAKKPFQAQGNESLSRGSSKSSGDLVCVAEAGVSRIKTSLKVDLPASDRSSLDSVVGNKCLHCKEELGKEGCGPRPRLNCRDCSQVMHYDCYVQWAGAAPGPWDVVQCPAHSKLSKHRKDQKDASKSVKSLKRSLSGSPRFQSALSPKSGTRKPSSEVTMKRAQSSSPTATSLSSPQLAAEILSLVGKKATTAAEPVASGRMKGRSASPTPSHSSEEDGTHHSPTASDCDVRSRNNQVRHLISEKAVKSYGNINDEELAMRLHRELNAPKRRRRGE